MRLGALPPASDAELEVFDLPPTLPIVLPVCRRLQIADTVDRRCPMKDGDHLTHGQIVEFLILHILQSPHRFPLYELELWADENNVEQIYGLPADKFNDDRVRRTLDAIYESIGDIQAAVVTQVLQQYSVQARTIHWDLTSVTFSEARADSELVHTGYGGGQINRRQVQVSLHTTDEGAIPVHHQTLAGKTHQAPLAPSMLARLREQLQRSDLIIVSDRAGVTYDNIVSYRQAQAHFIGAFTVADPKLQRQLAQIPVEQFKPLSYRSINAPDDFDLYYQTTVQLLPQKRSEPITVDALFIYSPPQQQRKMDERAKAIAKVCRRLDDISGHLKQPTKRSYAKRAYTDGQVKKAIREPLSDIVRYELSGDDGNVELRYWIDEDALARAAAGDGRWVLLYDLAPDQAPDAIFETYRRQGSIEARFRNFKSELSVHPLWLHTDERIAALLLIFVLALTVYSLLELCSVRAGLDTPHYHKMTAREMMKRFRRTQLLQVRVSGRPHQRELRLSEEQRHILRQMGLPDPIHYLN